MEKEFLIIMVSKEKNGISREGIFLKISKMVARRFDLEVNTRESSTGINLSIVGNGRFRDDDNKTYIRGFAGGIFEEWLDSTGQER